jgi:hypothetical protein
MATTVDEAFRDFHSRLTPSGTDSEAAKRHRASIYESLNSSIGLEGFFRTGSFGNGTSVRGHSDVDYFAVIPYAKMPISSSEALRLVYMVLNSRFPHTNVHIDGPAVVVPFGTDASETTEIVPAEERLGPQEIYQIPDGHGAWMLSAPTRHKAYIDGQDERLGGKLKPLIRFVKAWKYLNNVAISSFYLEMAVAVLMSSESAIVYSVDLTTVFARLTANQLPAVTDPTGIAGEFTPCDLSQRIGALAAVRTAFQNAEAARTAESNNRTQEAFRYWDRVFAMQFPAYY